MRLSLFPESLWEFHNLNEVLISNVKCFMIFWLSIRCQVEELCLKPFLPSCDMFLGLHACAVSFPLHVAITPASKSSRFTSCLFSQLVFWKPNLIRSPIFFLNLQWSKSQISVTFIEPLLGVRLDCSYKSTYLGNIPSPLFSVAFKDFKSKTLTHLSERQNHYTYVRRVGVHFSQRGDLPGFGN